MKLIALLGLLLFASPVLAAPTIDVWPENKMPGHGASEPEKDMPARPDGVRRETNVSRPTLTIFPTAQRTARTPAVIIFPGGGYSYVVTGKEGSEVAEWLNSVGITAFVLKYRVPNNREGALQDLQRSMSLVRRRAKQWNIDSNRIGVMGFSAGGNMAAKASTLFDQRAYESLDKIDKKSCRPDFVVLVYPAYLEKDGVVATDLNLKAKIPPTLIISTEDDKTSVSGSKVYHAALDKEKVKNTLLLYATGGHGYALRSDMDVRVWPQETLKWLKSIGISSK